MKSVGLMMKMGLKRRKSFRKNLKPNGSYHLIAVAMYVPWKYVVVL